MPWYYSVGVDVYEYSIKFRFVSLGSLGANQQTKASNVWVGTSKGEEWAEEYEELEEDQRL